MPRKMRIIRSTITVSYTHLIKEKKQMEELYQFMNEAKQKIEIADSFKDKEDVRDAGGT